MLRVITLFVALASLGAADLPGRLAVQSCETARPDSLHRSPGSICQSILDCDSQTATKPQLSVWMAATCPHSRQFWRDLEQDQGFRRAILSRFHIGWIDLDTHRAAGQARGIISTPTFDADGRRITGYLSKLWLWQRLTENVSETYESAQGEGIQNPEPIGLVTEDSEKPLAPLPRLRHPRTPPPDDSHINRRQAASPTSPARTIPMEKRSERRQEPEQRISLLSRLTGWVHCSVPVVLTGLEIAGILGGTVATGGVGTLAITALWRTWSRRRQSDTADGVTGSATAEEEAERAVSRAPFPRQLDEARQLLELRQSEGRVATLDALRGMFLDDELTKLTASGNGSDALAAAKLRTAIDARVDEVAPLSTTLE